MIKFLIFKNWQLFGLFLGLPTFLTFAIFIVVAFFTNNNKFFYTLPIIPNLTFIILLLIWYHSLGNNLCKKLPPYVNLNLFFFNVLLFFTLIIIIGISLYVVFSFYILTVKQEIFFKFRGYSWLFSFIFFLSILHSIYFLAKALKSVELQRKVIFRDFLIDIFLILFLPIGIWYIQPRINKVFE